MVKTALYLVVVLFAASCDFLERGTKAVVLGLPAKDLEEFIVWGHYQPANPNRLDNFRDEVIRQGRLKPGESFEVKYNHMLSYLDENFHYTSIRYCYYKATEKEAVFKDHFKIRLYDKEGTLLTEDFVRLEPDGAKEDGFLVVAYLPYHKAGHEIRIVRLMGQEEVFLYKITVNPHSELIQISGPPRPHRIGWTFSRESQCFIAPPIR